MKLPDIEIVSAKVHEAWMDSKRAKGVTSRKWGNRRGIEELMVPYANLSEAAKDLDRVSVVTVYNAINDLTTKGESRLMDATQLSQDLATAVEEQFGDNLPAEAFPSRYFNYDVRVIAPDGSQQQRNPRYCATAFGASQLAQVLKPFSIVMGNAVNFPGLLDSWSDTELVPYFVFTNANNATSKPVNAGLLMDYFNHGASPGQVASAMANVQYEIQQAFG